MPPRAEEDKAYRLVPFIRQWAHSEERWAEVMRLFRACDKACQTVVTETHWCIFAILCSVITRARYEADGASASVASLWIKDKPYPPTVISVVNQTPMVDVEECLSMAMDTGRSSAPEVIAAAPSKSRLSASEAKELKDQFSINYPGELLTPASTPSLAFLSFIQDAVESKTLAWVPWKKRSSELDEAEGSSLRAPTIHEVIDAERFYLELPVPTEFSNCCPIGCAILQGHPFIEPLEALHNLSSQGQPISPLLAGALRLESRGMAWHRLSLANHRGEVAALRALNLRDFVWNEAVDIGSTGARVGTETGKRDVDEAGSREGKSSCPDPV
eukprot:s777_g23.t1